MLLRQQLLPFISLLRVAAGLRVAFSVQTGSPLVPLQEFGAAGGFVNVSLSLFPLACEGDEDGAASNGSSKFTCWDTLDNVYLGLFNNQQLRNVSSRFWRNFEGVSDLTPVARDDCFDKDFDFVGECRPMQPCWELATAWSPVNLLEWQEAPIADDGAAFFDIGGKERFAGDGEQWSYSSGTTRDAPSPAEPLRYAIRYELPRKHDLYTLALYNCVGGSLRSELRASGEASFVGGDGERISSKERDVLNVRVGFLVAALVLAVAYASVCYVHRATMLPLHVLIGLVLLLRAAQHAFLLTPQLSTAVFDWRQPASGFIPAEIAHIDTVMWGPTYQPGRDAGGFGLIWPSPPPPLAADEPSPPPPTKPLQDDGRSMGIPARTALVVAVNGTAERQLERSCAIGAAAMDHLASVALLMTLIAVGAGRHFLAPSLPQREREAMSAAFLLFFGFGMIQEACDGPIICGVFVLCFQVVRILLVFGVVLFFNSSTDSLRRNSSQAWAGVRSDLVKLLAYRDLRVRVMAVYLILPILFMFLEVVLDWRADWFKTLWRQGLDMYMILVLALRVPPTPTSYAVFFADVRPRAGNNNNLAGGPYPRFFRWLLGSGIDAARADAAVRASAREAARARED